tara:strand:+ start:2420 stop:2605 length:186 start_codon:yes stop_codon:yes gene_type:complete
MKKPITTETIKRVISQYKKYKVSLGEDALVDTLSVEIADELRRQFIIEPIVQKSSKKARSK